MTENERLTHKRMNGIKEGYWSPRKKEELLQRLGKYEDTGMGPEEISAAIGKKLDTDMLQRMNTQIHLLKELRKARKWIPVEERLPEKNEYFVEMSGDKDFPNGYYKRLEIAYMTDTIEYVHGYHDGYKWMDKYHDTIKNVVAWRIHEPYQAERSDNHDGE